MRFGIRGDDCMTRTHRTVHVERATFMAWEFYVNKAVTGEAALNLPSQSSPLWTCRGPWRSSEKVRRPVVGEEKH